ncbi:hypothetical protein B0H14DRAFT_2574747 [Mycena olivaceomarginata]|nr:hypothetical protein B0H14DRAFT_2574747 [Mycena olivaceomarginata]
MCSVRLRLPGGVKRDVASSHRLQERQTQRAAAQADASLSIPVPAPRINTNFVHTEISSAASSTGPCPGLHAEWDNFWTTYPFHKHDPGAAKRLNYHIVSLKPLTLRSSTCYGQASAGQACGRCQLVQIEVNILRERASRLYDKVPAEDEMNHAQLRQKLASTKDTVNTQKLKGLDLKDSLTAAREELAAFKDLFNFIGTNRIPALHRIFWNASKEGWGVEKFAKQVRLAAQGKYKARNYTEYEIALSIMLYELGGGGTVYGMNHSLFMLPLITTIQPYRRELKITPSVSGLKFTDISKNISALFSGQAGVAGTGDTPMAPARYGHTLSFDELAIERKIDYMTETDEMGGLCCEHLSVLETVKVGKGIDVVEAAVDAVKEEKVHVAQEALVGAISRLSRTGYGARPVLIIPTCKKGTWADSVKTMLTVVEAWKRSPHGETMHGPLLSIASDGEPKRRAAMFVMCMNTEILPDNPLYPYICDLPGLNRRVGKDNLTEDPDVKHEVKCLRGQIVSTTGIVIKQTCINRDLLLTWLERLPGANWGEFSIPAVLNPADGQNVSLCIRLFLAIIDIKDLATTKFDPTEMAEFDALCLFGEMLDALIQPLINTKLSLSEQIESFVKFSHLICALYRENGESFLPNQLYGDFQATVKNAVLTVPKTRLIGGHLGVYICLLGDDVLETLFGRCRMIGGHSPNCSVGELRDRCCSAMNLDAVYEKYPELERPPRRLKLIRTRDLDHVKPGRWEGEVRADSCDLKACWSRTVAGAEAILRKHGVKMKTTFAQLFKQKDTDLMRPFGGKYPSISASVDQSAVDFSSADMPSDLNPNSTHNSLLHINFDEMIALEIAHLRDRRKWPNRPASAAEAGRFYDVTCLFRRLSVL